MHTVDVSAEQIEIANRNLAKVGAHNVCTHLRDGALGLSEFAPFNAILVHAAVQYVPHALMQQMNAGARYVGPRGANFNSCDLIQGILYPDGLHEKKIKGVKFMPLISEELGAFTEEEVDRITTEEDRKIENHLMFLVSIDLEKPDGISPEEWEGLVRRELEIAQTQTRMALENGKSLHKRDVNRYILDVLIENGEHKRLMDKFVENSRKEE